MIFNRLLKGGLFNRMPKAELFKQVSGHIFSKWIYSSKDGPAVIAFTSRMRREGVSTIVAGLAREFGSMNLGHILVLDVSPGQKGVANILGATVHAVDFEDLQDDESSLSDFIVHKDDLGIDILKFADSVQTNFQELQRERSLLNQVLSTYKIVLLDTGAMANGGRTHWLNYCQYRIFVVDSTKTTEEMLERQRKDVESSGISFDGTILNKKIYHIPKIFYSLVH